MGNIACKTNAKAFEDSKSEAYMNTAVSEKMYHTQALFKSMTTRVLSSRDELLNSAKLSFSSTERNFDSYYAFLSDQLKTIRMQPYKDMSVDLSTHCTNLTAASSTKQFTSSKYNKENLSVHFSKNTKEKKCSQAKRPVFSNLYLYVETPTQGILSRGGKLKPVIHRTTKNGKSKCKGHQLSVRDDNINNCPTNPNTSVAGKINQEAINLNFDIISLLPWNVQTLILSFLINQYRQCLCVSAVWHSTLLSSLDILFNTAENKLILKTEGFLNFRNSYTQSIVCNNGCWRGVRIDRVIQLEILKGYEGKTLTISYTYCFCNEKKNRYRTQYKFDCVAKGPRNLWIHKSENVLNGKQCTYTMNVMPVCTGDVVEIAANYYTPRGLIDVSSIEWQSINVENSPTEEQLSNRISTVATSRNGVERKDIKQRELLDLNRVCELETTETEWYDSNYYQMKEGFCDIQNLAQHFSVSSIEFASLDIKACKIYATANIPGKFNTCITQ